MQTDKGADKQAFTLVMITCAFIIPLIFVENLSTAALLSFVVFCMMIVGRVPFSQLGKLVGVVVIIASLALASIMLFGNDKKEMTAEGKAKTTSTPGLLRVAFFMNFYSDYRVLMIDKDYQYVLVGSGSPKYLWILSRTPHLDEATLQKIIDVAKQKGYDTDNLIYVKQ